MESYISGLPGFQNAVVATPRTIFLNPNMTTNLARGKQIDGVNASDPDNSPDVNVLRAGLLLGKITSSGLYGASIIGVTQGALAAGTSITLTAAQAVELVRRVGTSGTFTLTGPSAASGVVRSLTITYSAVNTTTGVVTITSALTNEVQQINFNIASTGGTVTLQVPKANGQMITTTGASWSATDGTYLANIQTVLDVATGVANGIVVSAIPATDPDLGFILTYSGTGYAGLPQPLAAVTGTLPTSSTTWTIARNTAGVSGAFVTGSLVGPTDGSQVPVFPINSDMDPYGLIVTQNDNLTRITVPCPSVPITGEVVTANLINYPADASLKAWVRNSLSTNSGGFFVFDDRY